MIENEVKVVENLANDDVVSHPIQYEESVPPAQFLGEYATVVGSENDTEISGTAKEKASMFKALAQYFGEVSNPENTTDNTFFKSKYAPLSEVLSTVRPIMGKYGLAIIQVPRSADGSIGSVQTILTHEDGAYMAFPPLVGKAAKADVQGLGAVITYLRRFALNAIAGVAGEVDDDGNTASDLKKSGSKTPEKDNPLKTELISLCSAYTNNDAARRKVVVDALKTIIPSGDVTKIRKDDDFKSAIELIKGLK